jgi:hypothetical protein
MKGTDILADTKAPYGVAESCCLTACTGVGVIIALGEKTLRH